MSGEPSLPPLMYICEPLNRATRDYVKLQFTSVVFWKMRAPLQA